MDEHYARTVRLLLTAAPAVFDNAIFAMKGGTAINLFIQDMPRLSVDIDVVYIPWQPNREEALHDIAAELERIRARLAPLGLIVRTLPSRDQSETKLFIENEISQVKVEVNFVFRGTVLSVLRQPLSRKTAELFSVELAAPLLAPDELYGSKLVAAMDRQHPRDLFDVWRLFETGGLSDAHDRMFCHLSRRPQPPFPRGSFWHGQGHRARVSGSLCRHDRRSCPAGNPVSRTNPSP
jgi:predicted nucleotidyltransferase component of viral defense system